MKSYPKYKSSGVDWLGEIPENWQTSRLKMFSKIYSGGTPDKTKNEYWENGTVPWIASGEVNQELITEVTTYITKEALKNSSTKWIPKNAIVMALAGQGRTKGTVAITGIEVTCNQSLAAIVTKNISYKYLFYWLKSKYQDIRGLVGEDRDGLNLDLIGAISIPIPSIYEQQQIVNFLDYKTEQCDRFIANRQKQIELLNEQLHFKINQAITKGINSQVKFKPTDIKYVPEIPEHWDIRKFKSLTSILTCGVAATPEYVEESEGVAFLSAQNCRPFEMDLSKYNYIKPSLHKQLTRYKKPEKGDVLVTRVGAGIGQACIIDTDLEFSIYVSLTHIRPNKEIFSEYIVYFFNTEYCYQLNHEGTVVAGGQGNLNVKNVERYRIPLPPIEEQKEIVTYLDNYRKEVDNLISKYQKQIDLMQEYRTALISQAVTGKIDVRDWKPPTK
jgi:type I restriction enzyme S subunit